MSTGISVVIPTFDRPDQLSKVVDCLFLSDVAGLDEVEVIVVDDGSSIPARVLVESKQAADPYILKYFYQENAGPAEARNFGLLQAKHKIVVFIDDDVLVSPQTIKCHLEAHYEFPGSVIFGPYPYSIPENPTPAYRYLEKLHAASISPICNDDEIVKVDVVASGNLSVERDMFLPDGVYRRDLQIPAAEEFELEYRLNTLNIPIFMSAAASAWHLQPPTISDKCKQEFKYGVGVAEIWTKMPGIIENKHISSFVAQNRFIRWKVDPIGLKTKKAIKAGLSWVFIRRTVLGLTNFLERCLPSDRLLFPLYRFLCGISLFAGIRHGLKIYKPK